MSWKMKVMLIDDEPNIREGLKIVIDWKRLNCEIIGEASNGKDGILLIQELLPDLVVVDIKMPEVDGISLIETITKMNLNVTFIVLSGYQDFQYAQRAMECKVNHYILKPIDEDILIVKIKEIYNELTKNRVNTEVWTHQTKISRNQIIKYIVKGYDLEQEGIIDKLDMEQLNTWYGFDFPWNSYSVVVLQSMEGKFLKEEIELLKKHMRSKDNKLPGYHFVEDGLFVLLVKDRNLREHKGTITYLKQWLKKIIKRDIIIAVGHSVDQLEEIEKSFHYARWLLENRFYYNDQTIIEDEFDGSMAQSILLRIDEKEISEGLYSAVYTYQPDKVNDLLEEMRKKVEMLRLDENEIKSIYLHIYINIIQEITRHYPEFLQKELLHSKIFVQFYEQNNLFKLHGFIKYQLLQICQSIEEISPQNTVGKIIEYIKLHYQEDIKLYDLSKVFHYSNNYIGKLLKQETNMTFPMFLEEIRMEEARRLLVDSDLRISDIAKKVGFNDPDYFTAKFKKITGLSPKDYRQQDRVHF